MSDSNLFENINDSCVCFSVRRLCRILTSFYDGILMPSGLKSTQLSLMMLVLHGGKKSLTELGKSVDMDRSTVNRNSNLLIKKGYLSRNRTKSDLRYVFFGVTAKGIEAINKAITLWSEAQSSVLHEVEVDDIAMIDYLIEDLKNIKRGRGVAQDES